MTKGSESFFADRAQPRFGPGRKMTLTSFSLAAVLIGLAAPLHAADLGRLFLTATERARLEELRAPAPAAASNGAESLEASSGQAPTPITVNGMVRRSDGTTTVWINGISSFDGDTEALPGYVDRARLSKGRVIVKEASAAQSVVVKPGQTYDPALGVVSEHHAGDAAEGD